MKGQRKMIFSCNDKKDPWSDHPETQFGPTYHFFRSLEPKPTLRT